MPVFRVEKNSNYTTMCNYHLRDQGLSLKGKGLLSMLLSLPDTWNYSVRGLSSITPDGVDGVLTALKELERLGYLERNQQRESNGRMGRAEYVIYERLLEIRDNYPKCVLRTDEFAGGNYQGIKSILKIHIVDDDLIHEPNVLTIFLHKGLCQLLLCQRLDLGAVGYLIGAKFSHRRFDGRCHQLITDQILDVGHICTQPCASITVMLFPLIYCSVTCSTQAQ